MLIDKVWRDSYKIRISNCCAHCEPTNSVQFYCSPKVCLKTVSYLGYPKELNCAHF